MEVDSSVDRGDHFSIEDIQHHLRGGRHTVADDCDRRSKFRVGSVDFRIKKIVFLSLGVIAGIALVLRMRNAEMRPNLCYTQIDLMLSVTATAQIVYIIVWVTKVCNTLERLQKEELLMNRNQGAGLRLNSLLALDLAFLWDRLSRFQLFLYSLLFATIIWTGKTLVYRFFSQKYSEMNSCEIVYSLIHNRVSQEPLSQGWILISAVNQGFLNLVMYVFPTIFIFLIVECSLIKES